MKELCAVARRFLIWDLDIPNAGINPRLLTRAHSGTRKNLAEAGREEQDKEGRREEERKEKEEGG